MPGKALTNLLEEIPFPTECQKFWEDPLAALLRCTKALLLAEIPVEFLLPNLTALPLNCSALPGPKHTPAAPSTTGNLTPATPTDQGCLLRQVTTKQPKLPQFCSQSCVCSSHPTKPSDPTG